MGLALQAAWLEADAGGASGSTGGSEPVFTLGTHTLAFTDRKQDRFELVIAPPALAAWPAQPIKVASGVAAEVVVESATLRTTAP